MPSDRRLALAMLLALLDAVLLAVGWALAPELRQGLVAAWPFDLVPGSAAVLRPLDADGARPWGAVVVPVWMAVSVARGRYTAPLRRRPWMEAVLDAAAGLGVLLALLFFLKAPHLSRTLLLGYAVATVPLTALASFTVARVARLRPRHPWRLAVVGPDAVVGPYAAAVARHPEWGVEVAARMSGDGAASQLAALVRGTVVDEVRVVGVDPDAAEVGEVARLCARLGTALTVDVAALGVRPSRVQPRATGVTLWFSPTDGPGQAAKRALDVVGAVIGLVLALPVLTVSMVAIRLVDGAPVWHVQTRAGLHGRPFRMVKLRTMVRDAEGLRDALAEVNEVDGPAFKLTDDPRITPLGRVLRRWSIDELPQLWHVLTGDMSLVGPRPALLDEVASYSTAQRRRLSVRPGLTGLWQVSGRSDLPYARWMALDLAYIDRWSLWGDLVLLARTPAAVLRGRGAR